MKTYDYLSLKNFNSKTVDEKIKKVEDRIKNDINDVFDSVIIAEQVGKDLLTLVDMKNARLLMSNNPYKMYERSGKTQHFTEFLEEYHKGL